MRRKDRQNDVNAMVTKGKEKSRGADTETNNRAEREEEVMRQKRSRKEGDEGWFRRRKG